jgi:DNA-binding transcriptional ArsR family regulator
MTAAYDVLKELRCATVREVAQRLGISEESARKQLKRLERRGAVEKKLVGRVVLYCASEGGMVELRRPPVRGLDVEMRIKQACGLLEREGCAPTAVLKDALNLNHSNAFHLMMRAVEHGCVKVAVGGTAVWCRSRAAAEKLMKQLRETVHKLAISNKMRYATPVKILQAALKDRDAYALLSRFVVLRRNVVRFPPVAIRFVDCVLRSLYGEPMRLRRKTVYIVSQPREDYTINITDSVDTHVVPVKLTDDLAAALEGVNVDEVVHQALEQLLQKYRT